MWFLTRSEPFLRMKVDMSTTAHVQQILLVGSGKTGHQLEQAFKAKGFNCLQVEDAHDDLADLKDNIKAVVVCNSVSGQQAVQITQRLSRLHLGPIWTVVDTPNTTHIHTHGSYHTQLLVNQVADAISAAQALDAKQSVARIYAPTALVGQPLDATYLLATQGVSLLGVQRPGQPCTPVPPDASIAAGDCYVVAGTPQHINSLSHTPLRLVAGAASW